MAWTRTATEVLHRGPFITLLRDLVIRPDGSEGIYEYVTVEDAVRVVAVDGRDFVALVEDDFYLQGKRALHLPGGGVAGQEHRAAALRELEEETGLVAGDVCLLGVIHPLPGATAARTFLFLAADLHAGAIDRDATEIGMTVRWTKFREAVEAVRAGNITEAGSVAALLLAAARRD